MKLWKLGAIFNPMAAVRSLAAGLLIVLASTLTAQNASTGQVVITVVDQIGAVIRGAHVGVIWLPTAATNDGDWLHYALHASEQASTRTDARGEAMIGLAIGSYAITIAAHGFQRYFKRIEIQDDSTQSFQATLRVDVLGDCFGSCPAPAIVIPLEHASLNIFIPLEPLQTITVTNARVRRRWLRF